MTTPRPYYWDYDRQPPSTETPFLTFSVGVFQWLPKASNKGVKKSKTIRVKGYMADREAVYAKAQQLCKQLNKEDVRIENPPSWLQKQYSVAKPEAVVIEKVSDDLTGAQVRSVRLKVLQRKLLTNGFIKGEQGTYVRRKGEQIHLIDFQAASYGHSWTVNLGFHYSFVPAFFQRKRIKTQEYTVLDCAIGARIGVFIDDGRDTWFEYGSDRDRLQAAFEKAADVCLSVFESYSDKWADPNGWLGAKRDGKVAPRHFRPWDTQDCSEDDLQLWIALIANHLEHFDISNRILTKLIDDAPRERDKKYFQQQMLRS